MNIAILLNSFTLFCAGILVGIEVAIHYGLRGPSEVLDERSQLEFRQALVLKLRVLVPTFFVPTAVAGIAVTVLDGFGPGFWLRGTAVLAMLVWASIRVVGTVPINSATLDWRPDAPPKDWKARVDHAERFHIVGVWAVILTFALFLVATALELAGN